MIDELAWQEPLAGDDRPLEAVAVVKMLPGDGGRPYLVVISTEGLSGWEALGMLDAVHASQLDDLVQAFRDDRDE